ncbi:MAG: hypothetical protein R3F31_22600 [Verrucomicrobiales bacterium]
MSSSGGIIPPQAVKIAAKGAITESLMATGLLRRQIMVSTYDRRSVRAIVRVDNGLIAVLCDTGLLSDVVSGSPTFMLPSRPLVDRGSLMATPLTQVGALRQLGFHDASAGQEVQLTGVVTYLRDAPGASAVANFNFNLNDETGGVMVYPSEHVRLAPGQQVEVRGVTAMSVHGLRIEKAVVTPVR